LHPQQATLFIEILPGRQNPNEKIFQKKIEKSLPETKTDVIFAPRKTRNALWNPDKKSKEN